MASLERLVVQLRQKKQDATKLKKKAEKQLKEVRAVERRSSSGLTSIARKIESELEDVSDTSDILIRKTSQLESIERLVEAAEDMVKLGFKNRKEGFKVLMPKLQAKENQEL